MMMNTITPLVILGIVVVAFVVNNGNVNQPEAESANGTPLRRRLTEEDPIPRHIRARQLEETCEQAARLDGASTEIGKSAMYESNPVVIGKQLGSSVEFTVDQNWKDGQVDWLAVMFQDVNGPAELDNQMSCQSSKNVPTKVGKFSAKCSASGLAEIAVFVRDETFSGLSDVTAQIPAACGASTDEQLADKYATFRFTIPCSEADENFCETEDPCDEETETEPTDAPDVQVEGGDKVDDPDKNEEETEDAEGGDKVDDPDKNVDGSGNTQGQDEEETEDAEGGDKVDDPQDNTDTAGGSGNTQDKTSTESGGGYGDPHIKTWLGHTFDFHGGCDLVLARSEKFNNGDGLDLHIRTQIRRDWSFISTAALKIGSDTFQVGTRGIYYQNGKTGPKMVGSMHLPKTIAGYPILYTHYDNKRHKYEVDLGEKGVVSFKVYNEFLAVAINNGQDDEFGDSVGLMGEFGTGKMLMRDGQEAHDVNAYGMDWQVRDTEPMLFHTIEGPQYPAAQCTMPPPSTATKRRLSESMVSYEAAEKACAEWDEEARESCIYDVLSTGDLDMAMAGAF